MEKILIFIGGYLPAKKYGGPVTSIVNLVDNLSFRFEFFIVSNNHEFGEKEPLADIHDGWNSVGNAQVLYLPEEKYSYREFSKIIKEIKPNFVYISSIFYYKMNFPVILSSKKNNIPVLLAPRGELCNNALKLQYRKKLFFIKLVKCLRIFNNIYFHATSEEEKENIIKYFNILSDKIFLLPNMHLKYNAKNTKYKEKNKLKILFISRIQEKKNLLYAINIVKKLSNNIEFDIYGPIEQKNYWNTCLMEMNNASSNIKIKYCGNVAPSETKEIYAQYDCLLFPTLSENYGHVIAEAVICNCPIVISKGTTPWDDVANNGGFTVNLDNPDDFINVLNRLCEMDNEDYILLKNKLLKYKDDKLNSTELIEKYLTMIKSI